MGGGDIKNVVKVHIVLVGGDIENVHTILVGGTLKMFIQSWWGETFENVHTILVGGGGH